MVELIFEKIADQEILMIMDNIDLLLETDFLTFTKVISDMLEIAPKLKILITSRSGLGKIGEFTEKLMIIPPLERVESIRLLQLKSPKPITEEEMGLLALASDDPTGNKNELFFNHHLFDILGEHPQAIAIASSMLKDKSLVEIYRFLKYVLKNMQQCDPDPAKLSLFLSFEASILLMQTVQPDAFDIFMFFCMTPSGIHEEDMESMWIKWKMNKNVLLDQNLIQLKDYS